MSPGPITLSSTLPRLTAFMKIPGSPGTQGLSRPPLIFSPSLPRRPDKERRKVKSLSIFDQLLILFRRFIVMDGQRVKELLTTDLEKVA